jgi:hypothetical protein
VAPDLAGPAAPFEAAVHSAALVTVAAVLSAGTAWLMAVHARTRSKRFGHILPFPSQGWLSWLPWISWEQAIYLRRRRPAQLRSYRVQAEAEHRAAALLREVVGEPAFDQLRRRGHLEVRSPLFPSRVYLVPERQGPVTVCEHGRPVMRLCVQTVERVPDHDTVVMHKLMIEGNEREYLRIANRV